MSNHAERNQEFEEVINTDKKEYLSFFVSEFGDELDDIESTLESEASKMLINWVRHRLRKLHEDFNADL